MSRKRNPATIVAAAKPKFDRGYASVAPPIVVSDTFRWDDADDKPEFDYSRTVSPNRDLLVEALSELEGAAGGIVTNSGQSAVLLTLLRLPIGARVVAPHDCYGGTYRLFQRFADQKKIDCTFVDFGDAAAFEAALGQSLDLLWIETPSNPLLRISDIAACASAAKQRGALVAADNTLSTPLRQRPLELGCDLVMHSTTKALNGHSDLFGGALLAKNPVLVEELQWWSNAAGLNGSAFDSSQILRGLRTLPLRVERQESSAAQIAGWLAGRRDVQAIHYPGLAQHPGHDLAERQQSGPGFVLSFRIEGGKPATDSFLSALDLITLASSLGGFATLICAPSSMTQRGMPPDAQKEAGIHSDLLRLSVGLEHPGDLMADLEKGFAAAANH
jgi:cystathionine gamma-synthase